MRRGYVAVGLMILAGSAGGARAVEDGHWQVGLAKVKITPQSPVFLAGYASRNKPHEAVENDLFAKAMALEDGAGRRALLITADLIGFQTALAEPVAARIAKATGVERSAILLNASHTHTGPALRVAIAAGAKERPDNNLQYVRQLEDQLIELAKEAIGRLAPARLSWGLGTAEFVMNRREFTPTDVKLGVNPRGYVDRSVPILRVDRADGTLAGVLFGCACHNTTLGPQHYIISGDYAGFAQSFIEEAKPGAIALFLQGFGGDANPYPRGSVEAARVHGGNLGREVCRVLATSLTPVRGPLRTVKEPVALPIAPHPNRDELARWQKGGGWRKAVADQIVAHQQSGAKPASTYAAPIAVWQFGEDLTLVGLPGEVVAGYVALLEARLGSRRLWLAGYCNDVFGYLPTAKVLDEGGYETRGLIYGGAGIFRPQVEEAVVAAAAAAAAKAGRKSAAGTH